MSGSFWRFGNGYNEVSSLNALLENAFVPTLNRQRTASTSTSSSESTDSEDDNTHGENPDETIEEEENDFTPNLDILGQLLDEQDILDELATSNLKLIEFLRHREVLEELIKYIVTNENDITEEEPLHPEEAKKEEETEAKSETSSDDKSSTTSSSDSEDMSNLDQPETPQETHARRAQVAAEILSSDSWSLTDSFMDNHDLLDKLWCVLDNESLSMVLSTYFMKINEHLLDLKIDEMLNFLLNQNNLVDRFIRHIDNPPLMDFLLKVISTDKPDASTGIIECLKDQGLIPKLVDFLHPDVNPSIQSAAGDFIKAFVTISANSNADNSTIGPNELTRELVSEPIMEKLCGLMLNGGTSLANGVGIIIEIIRKNNSDYDFVPVLFITIESHPPTSRDSIYLGHLIKVFSRNIPKFAKMLGDTKLADLDTPFGSIEPLGFERFKICELIAELLHCSNMALLNDVSGEEIVRERDIERERVIALEKQQRDEEFDTDAAMSRDVSGLALEAEDEKENSDGDGETLEIQYDENEAILRKDPVVGDLLKIALADNGVILMILKMFFRFPWNNFLHNVVFDIVQQILNGSMKIGYNKYLSIDLFGRGQITKLIIEGQEKCESYEEENGLRLGYMGHLTLIAEEVVKFTALFQPSTIHQLVLDASSSDEDDIDADRDVSSGTGLTRTKSKGELNWDDDEQNRLINMASYIKTHTKSPSSSNDADKQ
ncbi:Extragenic suppressor of kinetochore protein 1 [Cyberlindnera fabianii]|uniref:Extragenic suppressor of kinetochore protein 1 n=1 Tax=Cyberlindnera fabianii TaxID=36022 RepID=A0A1V2L3L4_CYBFA|nr:Extragenic suppressor of kinetochore protein 1 [Cyberlindnera fabianii]